MDKQSVLSSSFLNTVTALKIQTANRAPSPLLSACLQHAFSLSSPGQDLSLSLFCSADHGRVLAGLLSLSIRSTGGTEGAQAHRDPSLCHHLPRRIHGISLHSWWSHGHMRLGKPSGMIVYGTSLLLSHES